MEAAEVDRVVLVPPSWQGDSNDFVLEAAHQYPDRFAVMGRIDPATPQDEAALSELKRRSGMKGLRLTFSTGRSLATPEMAWLWPAAERADIPLALAARSEMLQDVENIAKAHPGIKLAIDHFAVVRNAFDDAAFADLPQLLALAKLQNIAVKVSALPCLSTEAYPYKGLHKYVRHVYEAFGPERMFWGSDLSRLPCSYRQAVTVFTEEMPWLSATDKESIMGGAICRWLGWERVMAATLDRTQEPLVQHKRQSSR
jgi:predicted TIM-barrel fold metal-dependent hydrolase